MIILRKTLWIVLGTCITLIAGAQEDRTNDGNILSFSVSYGLHQPGGDLSERFGRNFAIGMAFEYMTDKSNLILGLDASFLFGSDVKEDVLAPLRDKDGLILGLGNQFSDVKLRERGLFTGLTIGRVFPFSTSNRRSGIRVTLTPGILQHKIRLQDDSESIPQITGDYEKGYDRLTRGFALKETIGYQYISQDRRVNFYVGFEFLQGFTKSSRPINFDTGLSDDGRRTDLLWGLKLSWYLPFFLGGEDSEEIFY